MTPGTNTSPLPRRCPPHPPLSSQPFVALARGLCNQLGWLVTLCTEYRWKEWVEKNCADITDGAVIAEIAPRSRRDRAEIVPSGAPAVCEASGDISADFLRQVQFVPSGGDTTLQTESWFAQLAMNSKADAMQARRCRRDIEPRCGRDI